MKITPNAVISGVIRNLTAKDYTVYKETMTNPAYPHCFVESPNLNVERQGNLFLLTYLITIQYRYNAEPHTVGDINKRLDLIGLDFMTLLDSINADGQKLLSKNMTLEKVDGVLQCNMNFTVKANKDEVEEILMEELEVNERTN